MEVRDDCLYSLLGIGKSVVKNNRVDVVEIMRRMGNIKKRPETPMEPSERDSRIFYWAILYIVTVTTAVQYQVCHISLGHKL